MTDEFAERPSDMKFGPRATPDLVASAQGPDREAEPRRDGSELQGLLAVLLDLELSVKHAHWNCYGAGFRDLHQHLQVLADKVGSKADEVAERSAATGVSPDGRAAAIVAGSSLPTFPGGPILVDAAIAGVASAIDGVIGVCERYRTYFAASEPVSDSVVISILEMLQRHRWMLLAEFSAQPPARSPASST